MSGAEEQAASGAAVLERRYRRLMVSYPAQYRRVHEDEMLAVLMTGAPEGKRRPGIAEAADLVLGALRVRCQPTRGDGSEPAWRDALAVVSVILPVVILLVSAVGDSRMAFGNGAALGILRQLATPLALMALVLSRLRRVAALAAVAMLFWLIVMSGGSTYVYWTADAPGALTLGLEILALTASPGPRRGLQILTWKHWAYVVIATLAVSLTTYPAPFIVIVVIGAAMALTSSLGRWLLLLLAIPAFPYFLGDPISLGVLGALDHLSQPLAFIAPNYLLPLALLVLGAWAARRESRRSSQ